MKLFRIVPDSDVYNKVRTLEYTSKGCDEILNENSLINTWVAPLIGIVEDGKSGDFLSWGGSVVCSERVYKLLKSYNLGIEFLPLKRKKEENAYYAFNIMDVVPLDLKNAEVEFFFDGEILAVEKYAFKKQDIGGKLIFNPEQAKHEGPIVTEEFKKIIEENKLEGLIFKEVFEF